MNEGRGFEVLIPAMAGINCKLIICGEGNFFNQVSQLVKTHNLTDKVILKGMVLPQDLKDITIHAYIGITLFEDSGLSNYLSLANRFFDYMHAAIPQVCMNFPLYKEINNHYKVASFIDHLTVDAIQKEINFLLNDDNSYYEMQQNCLAAKNKYNWQNEELKLINFYKRIFE